jgi:hypothetical protein
MYTNTKEKSLLPAYYVAQQLNIVHQHGRCDFSED